MKTSRLIMSRFKDGTYCSNPSFVLLSSGTLTKEEWMIKFIKDDITDNLKTINILAEIDFTPVNNGLITVVMLISEPFMNQYLFADFVNHAKRHGFVIANSPEVALLLCNNVTDEELRSIECECLVVPFLSSKDSDQIRCIIIQRACGDEKRYFSHKLVDQKAKYSSRAYFAFVKEITTAVNNL
jgi:hypothetical protein